MIIKCFKFFYTPEIPKGKAIFLFIENLHDNIYEKIELDKFNL